MVLPNLDLFHEPFVSGSLVPCLGVRCVWTRFCCLRRASYWDFSGVCLPELFPNSAGADNWKASNKSLLISMRNSNDVDTLLLPNSRHHVSKSLDRRPLPVSVSSLAPLKLHESERLPECWLLRSALTSPLRHGMPLFHWPRLTLPFGLLVGVNVPIAAADLLLKQLRKSGTL